MGSGFNFSPVPNLSSGGFSPYSSSMGFEDFLFSVIVMFGAYFVLWLTMSVLFKVLPQTVVMIAIMVGLLSLPMNLTLFITAIVVMFVGSRFTRIRPIPPNVLFRSPYGSPPTDDFQFYLYAEQATRLTGSPQFQRLMESPAFDLGSKMSSGFEALSISMYRRSIFWSLTSVSCLMFFYMIADAMPSVMGIFIIAMIALETGMMIGMMLKRRAGEKIFRRARI